MKIGFENPDYEEKISEMFDFYIDMIKNSPPGTLSFNFASQMLKNQLDFMLYNREFVSSLPVEALRESVEK